MKRIRQENKNFQNKTQLLHKRHSNSLQRCVSTETGRLPRSRKTPQFSRQKQRQKQKNGGVKQINQTSENESKDSKRHSKIKSHTDYQKTLCIDLLNISSKKKQFGKKGKKYLQEQKQVKSNSVVKRKLGNCQSRKGIFYKTRHDQHRAQGTKDLTPSQEDYSLLGEYFTSANNKSKKSRKNNVSSEPRKINFDKKPMQGDCFTDPFFVYKQTKNKTGHKQVEQINNHNISFMSAPDAFISIPLKTKKNNKKKKHCCHCNSSLTNPISVSYSHENTQSKIRKKSQSTSPLQNQSPLVKISSEEHHLIIPSQQPKNQQSSSVFFSLTCSLVEQSQLISSSNDPEPLPSKTKPLQDKQSQTINVDSSIVNKQSDCETDESLLLSDIAPSIQPKTIQQKGKIFLQMTKLFGNQLKSKIYRFIQTNQHLELDEIVGKWIDKQSIHTKSKKRNPISDLYC